MNLTREHTIGDELIGDGLFIANWQTTLTSFVPSATSTSIEAY